MTARDAVATDAPDTVNVPAGRDRLAAARPADLFTVTRWTRDELARSTLRHAPRAVALVLATYADLDGGCYPSTTTIGAVLGLNVGNVRRALRELESAGMVATAPRRGRSSFYRLAVPAGVRGPREIVHTPRASARGRAPESGSELSTPRAVPRDTPRGTARTPRAVPRAELPRNIQRTSARDEDRVLTRAERAAAIERGAAADRAVAAERRPRRAFVATPASLDALAERKRRARSW